LGDFAFNLIKNIKQNRDIIIYSEFILRELLTGFGEDIVEEIFSIVSKEGLLEKVDVNEEQIKEAGKLSIRTGVHINDCIHAIIAKDNNAVLVTRDKHFEAFRDIVQIRKPEDLL